MPSLRSKDSEMTANPGQYRLGVHKVAVLASALALVATLSGCLNEIMTIGYLIGGPPSIEPDFEIATKESLTDKDVTVAVVCYAPKALQAEYEEIHFDVAKYVSLRLTSHHVKVVNPDQVRAWLDRNDDWDKPEDVGAALDVTYVVYIDLNSFSLWEEHSSNLFRGRAEAIVSVTKMNADKSGDKIYSKEKISKFPLMQPRSTSEVSYETFKREYLSRLSEEIGRLFYEYYNGDDFVDAT
jgi:hypothetical protein